MEASFYGLHYLLRGESMEAILFIALSTKMAQNATKVAAEMGFHHLGGNFVGYSYNTCSETSLNLWG